MDTKKQILPIIVISQFCCTSLWFAGNAVMTDLVYDFNLNPEALGHLTSAVQFGFICGTLFFAFLTIADGLITLRNLLPLIPSYLFYQFRNHTHKLPDILGISSSDRFSTIFDPGCYKYSFPV